MAQVRGSLVVNSQTDRIRRSTNLPSSENFSMGGWFKASSLQSTWQYICAIASTGGGAWIGAALNTNNSFQADSVDGAVDGTYSSFSASTWYYVGLTGSGTAAIARLWNSSGTLLFTSSAASAAITEAWIDIGNDDYAGGEAAYGNYCYWRVWNAVLSSSEFEDEMFSEVPVRTSNLDSALHNADGTDLSGNGRDWSLVNITTSSDYPDVFGESFNPIPIPEPLPSAFGTYKLVRGRTG